MLALVTTKDRYGHVAKNYMFDWLDAQLEPGTFKYVTPDADLSGFDKVLILGKSALYSLRPDLSFQRVRGQFIAPNMMATFSPLDVTEYREDYDADGVDINPTTYRAWISRDLYKLLNWKPDTLDDFSVDFNIGRLIDLLRTARDTNIFLDIECTREMALTVVGLAVGDSPVYPIRVIGDGLYYSRFPELLAVLTKALQRNTVVCHNAMFDLVVLAMFYHIPTGPRIYDTMLVHHRFEPELEKSLGHAISWWTTLPYHKDQGIVEPKNEAQWRQLLHYNALDVYGMRLVYKRQQAEMRPEVALSAKQACDSIYPYLVATLHGLPVDENRLLTSQGILSRRIKQLTRIVRIMSCGMIENPNSVQQCANFFFDWAGYKPLRFTDTGRPAFSQDEIFKICAQNPHPIFGVIAEYREAAKELSMLKFTPYPGVL